MVGNTSYPGNYGIIIYKGHAGFLGKGLVSNLNPEAHNALVRQVHTKP